MILIFLLLLAISVAVASGSVGPRSAPLGTLVGVRRVRQYFYFARRSNADTDRHTMTSDTPTTDPPVVVAAPERRRVVAGLADGAVETVADLRVRGRADEIAAELRETHLPALEEAGYIEWDREAGTIEPGPNFEEAAAHVDDLPIPDPSDG
jgi:hypothetical protein